VLDPAVRKTDTVDMRPHSLARLLQTEVALLVEPLEKKLDLQSSAIETVLSVLELDPYRLLTVEGTHFDTVVGRFRVSDMRLSALAKEDILVGALLKTNSEKNVLDNDDVMQTSNISALQQSSSDSNSVLNGGYANFKDANGMNDSYGLGYDCSASAAAQSSNSGGSSKADEKTSGWQRDRQLGGSYGGKIQEFRSSRMKMAMLTGLSVEDVSNGLYKLQKQGMLEYKLQDSSLYLSLCVVSPVTSVDNAGADAESGEKTTAVPPGPVSFVHYLQTSYAKSKIQGHPNSLLRTTSCYYEWIWQLATQVSSTLQVITLGGSKRLVDMWCTGKTVAHYTSCRSISEETSRKMGGGTGGGGGGLLQRQRLQREQAESTLQQQQKFSTAAEIKELFGAVQSLLGFAMEVEENEILSGKAVFTSNNTETAEMVMEEKEGDAIAVSLADQMQRMYVSCPGPFKPLSSENILASSSSSSKVAVHARNTEVDKVLSSIYRDVSFLKRDPVLLTVVNTIMRECTELLTHQATIDSKLQASTVSPTGTLKAARNELLAMCICRIMHALASRQFPANEWRDRASDVWGSYKDYDFSQLLQIVSQNITVIGQGF
jgi:hypothetical protein